MEKINLTNGKENIEIRLTDNTPFFAKTNFVVLNKSVVRTLHQILFSIPIKDINKVKNFGYTCFNLKWNDMTFDCSTIFVNTDGNVVVDILNI